MTNTTGWWGSTLYRMIPSLCSLTCWLPGSVKLRPQPPPANFIAPQNTSFSSLSFLASLVPLIQLIWYIIISGSEDVFLLRQLHCNLLQSVRVKFIPAITPSSSHCNINLSKFGRMSFLSCVMWFTGVFSVCLCVQEQIASLLACWTPGKQCTACVKVCNLPDSFSTVGVWCDYKFTELLIAN